MEFRFGEMLSEDYWITVYSQSVLDFMHSSHTLAERAPKAGVRNSEQVDLKTSPSRTPAWDGICSKLCFADGQLTLPCHSTMQCCKDGEPEAKLSAGRKRT